MNTYSPGQVLLCLGAAIAFCFLKIKIPINGWTAPVRVGKLMTPVGGTDATSVEAQVKLLGDFTSGTSWEREGAPYSRTHAADAKDKGQGSAICRTGSSAATGFTITRQSVR